jgi:type II secretion system protein N
MNVRRNARLKLVLGYTAFAVAAFVFFFYVTFPYDALRSRLRIEASKAGWDVKLGSLGPGFLGLKAKKVELRKKPLPGEDEEAAQWLHVDALALRPSLFPLGVAFSADLMGGSAKGAFGAVGGLTVMADLRRVDLSRGNLKAFSGLDLNGELDGKLALKVPVVALGGNSAPEPDFGQANGSFKLVGRQVMVNGGTIVIPMYGTPTPMDLPKIAFGELTAQLKIEKGQGTVDALSAKSQDIELVGTGSLKLAKRLEYSEPNLELKFKAEQDFVKRLGMLGAGLAMMRSDPQNPQFKIARITGFMGKPNFQ